MTSYVVLLPGDEAVWAAATEEEQPGRLRQALEVRRGTGRARPQGHRRRRARRLQAAQVVRSRRRTGSTITEGPYAETVEQLTGFYLDRLRRPRRPARLRRHPRRRRERHRGAADAARRDSEADGLTEVERVLRNEWARLVALLVAQYRRLDLAEDGLGDAFEAAARTWPDGVPDNPTAWLLTTARRRIVDRLRTEAVAGRKLPLLAVEAHLTEEAQRVMADAGEPVVDERLRLVLLCAHPALAPESAAALTLRLVLGVSTADIARLFLVSQADDGRPADPGPQAAGRRVVLGADRRRARVAGRRSSPTSPTWRSPPATHPARAPTCCGPRRRARRSGWCGCCGRCCPRTTPAGPTSTRCSR